MDISSFFNFNSGAMIAAAVISLAFIAFTVAYLLRVVVPMSMVHIVQRTNTTAVYGYQQSAGNVYYRWPEWLPRWGVTVVAFPEAIFTVSLIGYEAYDAKRVPFTVDVVSFFAVSDAKIVAKRTQNQAALEADLRKVVEGAVRRILSTNNLEQIMELRAEFGTQFTELVKEQTAQWGVVPAKSLELLDIRDSRGSEVISNIMAKEMSRIETESRTAVASNKREAEVAEIQARQEVDLSAQNAAQLVGARTAEKEKAVGIANEQAQQDIKSAQKVTAEREMEVRKVTEVQTANIAREVAVVAAQQEKDVQITRAEADKEQAIVIADGALQAAHKDAQGIETLGNAKAAAETAMLMAPVEAQLKLAREIGTNQGYQGYLVTSDQIKASKEVGLGMAEAMGKADMKVIANGGDVQSGISSLGDIFSTKGGTSIGSMLTALNNTPEGKQMLDSLLSRVMGGSKGTFDAVEKTVTDVPATPAA